jgi:serine/threonine-protein kinase
VLSTVPPANQTSAITNEITIVVGKGPATAVIPECVGQSVEVCQQILGASGFTKTVPVEIDSTEPTGQVVGVEPTPGQTVPQDSVIQIQVSRGNQFVMPDLTGMFWTDAEPRLRALGWTGVLDKGGDVQNSGQRTNAVVSQNPPAGAGVTYGSRITLNFAS